MTGLAVWIAGLIVAWVVGFVALRSIQSFRQDLRSQQTRYWMQRAVSRAARPGWYSLILAVKAFSILALGPLAILAVWIVVTGILRLFTS